MRLVRPCRDPRAPACVARTSSSRRPTCAWGVSFASRFCCSPVTARRTPGIADQVPAGEVAVAAVVGSPNVPCSVCARTVEKKAADPPAKSGASLLSITVSSASWSAADKLRERRALAGRARTRRGWRGRRDRRRETSPVRRREPDRCSARREPRPRPEPWRQSGIRRAATASSTSASAGVSVSSGSRTIGPWRSVRPQTRPPARASPAGRPRRRRR